jgi:hypothetical protein
MIQVTARHKNSEHKSVMCGHELIIFIWSLLNINERIQEWRRFGRPKHKWNDILKIILEKYVTKNSNNNTMGVLHNLSYRPTLFGMQNVLIFDSTLLTEY